MSGRNEEWGRKENWKEWGYCECKNEDESVSILYIYGLINKQTNEEMNK